MEDSFAVIGMPVHSCDEDEKNLTLDQRCIEAIREILGKKPLYNSTAEKGAAQREINKNENMRQNGGVFVPKPKKPKGITLIAD